MALFKDAFAIIQNNSSVRNWAIYVLESEKYNQRVSVTDYFLASIIFDLHDFGKHTKIEKKQKNLPKDKKHFSKYPYAGDSSIFEIICYFSFLTDLWLYSNANTYREEFQELFSFRIVNIFGKSFGMEVIEVGKILNDRISQYGKIYHDIKSSEYTKHCHDLLSNLLYFTKNGKVPIIHEKKVLEKIISISFSPESENEYDIISDFQILKMMSLHFEEYFYEVYIASLRDIIKSDRVH